MDNLKFLFFTFLFALSISANGQAWLKNVKKDAKLSEVSEAFEDYWSKRPIVKGCGYKVFKRAEWFMQSRLDSDGNVPSGQLIIDEFYNFEREFKSNNATDRTINDWKALGPRSSTSGYAGVGRINCMAFHPTDENTFYIGGAGGGVHRTNDGGKTWTNITSNLPIIGVSDLLVDATNPHTLYVATGDADGHVGSGFSIYSMGIFKSIDDGNTWTQFGKFNYEDRFVVYKMLQNPQNKNSFLFATNKGLIATQDGGTNFSLNLAGFFTDIKYAPDDPNIVYASSFGRQESAQIFKSFDSGRNWTQITSFNDKTRFSLAVTKANPNILLILSGRYDSTMGGIFVSTDKGASINLLVPESLNILGRSPIGKDNNGQAFYDLCLSINPNKPNEFFTGGICTWKSLDAGQSMQLANFWINDPGLLPNTPIVHADKHNIYFHPLNSQKLYECNDGGLYVSTDNGLTWTDLTNGLDISQFYKLDISQQNSNTILGGLQDNGTKMLNNTNWQDVGGGDGMDCGIDHTDDNIQYGSYPGGTFYRTLDKWNKYGGDNIISVKGVWVTPFVISKLNASTILTADSIVLISKDRGNTWFEISPPGLDLRFDKLAISPFDERIIMASSGRFLYATYDGGLNWATILEANNFIQSIAFDPYAAQWVYVTLGGFTANNKVLLSRNLGKDWTNMSSNLPNIPVNCITMQDGKFGEIYIGTDFGVFVTKIGKDNWELFSKNFPIVPVTDLVISKKDHKLYASTYGRGVWFTEINPPAVTTASPTAIVLPASKGSSKISIKSTIPWKLKYEDSYADYDIISLNGQAGTGDMEVSFNYNKNTLPQERQGKLFVETENESLPIDIRQEARNTNTTITPLSLKFPASPEGCDTLTLTSSDDWVITYKNNDPNYEILKSIEPKSGNGDAKIVVCYNENALPLNLAGLLTVESSSLINVNITQDKSIIPSLIIYKEPNLNFKESNVIISADGGKGSSYAITNDNLFKGVENVIIRNYDKQWLKVNKVDKTSFAPFMRIEFEAKPNDTKINRFAKIKVVYNNNQDSAAIVLNQPADSTGYLNVHPNEIKLNEQEYKLENKVKFFVTSDLDWEVDENLDWASVNKNAGQNNGEVTLTITANQEPDDREGKIKITAKDIDGTTLTREIKMIQLSKRSFDEGIKCALYPNPVSKTLFLNVESDTVAFITLDLSDITGKKIGTLYHDFIPSGSQLIQLDVSQYPRGAYYAKISTVSSIKHEKIIIH